MTTNPFPGLRPFEADENHLFFGRDGQSDEMLTRLRCNRFVAVVGTSGSGKSSLIRAGLLPSLHGGFMVKAGSRWRVAVFRPGIDPIHNLASALNAHGVLGDGGADPGTSNVIVETTLRRGAFGLIEAIRHARMPAQENLLIVVDQFEELFRFKSRRGTEASEEDAAVFVKLLIEASRQSEVPIYVVITMRSDFLGDCARFRELPETINEGLYLIPLMTRGNLREAIAGPVAVAGGEISPPLVNRLLNDVGGDPEKLPILQHALMRTWTLWTENHREGEPIQLRHYEETGGMAEALSRHADEAYYELSDDQEKVAEKIFRVLTEKGPGDREVRRPTKVAEICAITGAGEEDVIAIIENFRRPGRSFLMPPSEVPLNSESLIDISHESLIRGWKRLRDWVDGEALSAAIYRRVADTAVLYGEEKAALWRDPDLQVALGWRDTTLPTKAWGEHYHPGFEAAMNFLDESQAARDASVIASERQRVKNLRRTQVFATVLTLLFVAALALAFYAFGLRSVAIAAQRDALDQAAAARKQTLIAEQREREANLARAEAIEAEKKATREARNARLAERKASLEAERARLAEQEASAAARRALVALAEAKRQKQVAEQRTEDFRLAAIREQGHNLEMNWLANELIRFAPPRQAVLWHTVSAQALTLSGNHEAAEEQLSLALAIEPDYPDARMIRGYMYILNNKIEKSIEDFDNVIKLDPNSSLAYLNKGISQGILGQYKGASSSIDKAINLYMPGMYDVLSENEVSGDIQRTTGYTRLVADEKAFRTALYFQLANIQAFEGDEGFVARLAAADKLPKSRNAYLTALNWAWLQMAKNGKDYGGLISQGAIWERMGYRDEAARSYREFLAKHDNPKQHDKRYDKLADWVNQRMVKLRRVAFRPEEKENARAMSLRAKELTAREQYPQANDLLAKAILQDPENIDLLLQRAELRNRMRDFRGSREDAEKVVEIAGALPVPKAYLYRAYASGDAKSREADFRRVLKYSPTNVQALTNLSQIVEERDPNEALTLLDTSIKVTPFDPNLYYRKANLLNERKRYREALQAIEIAIAMKNDDLSYYDLRARAEVDDGKNRTEVARNLASGYRETGDALVKRGEAGRGLDIYVKSLKLLAAATKQQNDEETRSSMGRIMRRISRLIETQGSRAKAIEHLKIMFGDVKGLETLLNEEVRRLSSPLGT